MTTAYIALGSNLGDRAKILREALDLLGRHATVTHVSSFHETEPVGGPSDQGKYLNAAAEIQTDLAPRPLLQLLLSIEDQLGRVRGERFGPRTLDLDLLLHGQEVIAEPGLVVPHPMMHERAFVLVPLAEIAPLAVHPVLQSTVADLSKRLSGVGGRELTGLKALVTGSTSGIGRAIALELAEAGAGVLIHGRRSHEQAEQTARACREHKVQSAVLLADLREESRCLELARTAWDTWGALDIWINNAGADTLTGEAARWPFARKLAELWAVDVQATITLSRLVGGWMKERGRGVIVNMGWNQADTGMEGDSGQLFGASKAAVMAFSKSLAMTLAPQVRVNCLAPGWIRTAWGERASSTWQERVVRETPLQRWGTPFDVAKTARWLASPAAAYITGQVIRIDGGAIR